MTEERRGSPRLLVLDAYAREGRKALVDSGATRAGELYASLLRRLVADATIDIAYAADEDPGLPSGVALRDYDGAVWTGSSLTIHLEGDARVHRQVELARSLLGAGVNCFGSCWAIQLAAIAGGGSCGPSPHGREFGVARRIALNPAGQAHPLFRGKPAVFDALASHADEVTSLPSGATLLASNGFSEVQAAVIPVGEATFQAVQYHPEYDLHEVACLARLRAEELVAQGSFSSTEAIARWSEDLERLHAGAEQPEIEARHGLGDPGLDDDLRHREVGNWLDSVVLSRGAR